MKEISWGFFSRRQKVKIPLYLTSFDDFFVFGYKKSCFFQRSKTRKMFGVPTASCPTPGGGIMWYLMVPYGHATFCSHTLRCGGGAICSHTCSHTPVLIPLFSYLVLGGCLCGKSVLILDMFSYLVLIPGSHTRFSYLCWGMRTNGPPPTAENVARPYGGKYPLISFWWYWLIYWAHVWVHDEVRRSDGRTLGQVVGRSDTRTVGPMFCVCLFHLCVCFPP